MFDQLRKQLLDLGAVKLSWVIEHEINQGHSRWTYTFQAANDMGAPIELPLELSEALQQAVHNGQLGPPQADIHIMDIETGRIEDPQPRPGDGAGAPGIAERLP